MAVDVESLVPILEAIGLFDVIVVAQYGERQALAETSRTVIKKEAVGLFYLSDEAGLIHIVAVVTQHAGEVHNPVGYALARGRDAHRH